MRVSSCVSVSACVLKHVLRGSNAHRCLHMNAHQPGTLQTFPMEKPCPHRRPQGHTCSLQWGQQDRQCLAGWRWQPWPPAHQGLDHPGPRLSTSHPSPAPAENEGKGGRGSCTLALQERGAGAQPWPLVTRCHLLLPRRCLRTDNGRAGPGVGGAGPRTPKPRLC